MTQKLLIKHQSKEQALFILLLFNYPTTVFRGQEKAIPFDLVQYFGRSIVGPNRALVLVGREIRTARLPAQNP